MITQLQYQIIPNITNSTRGEENRNGEGERKIDMGNRWLVSGTFCFITYGLAGT